MIELNFKNSVIISTLLHIILLFFLPEAWFSEEQPDWVEVSVTTFPAPRERIPEDWSLSGEDMPEKEFETRPEDIQSEEISVPARESSIGLPVDNGAPSLEDIEKTRVDTPVEETVSKALPDREKRTGIPQKEGDESSEVLEGPVSRRKVLRRIQPEYPSWAEEQGAEGEVKLKFWVSPSGHVKSVEVLQTSGYPNLDSRAMEAMRKYLFEPLGEEEEQEEQWGTIIIRYTLNTQ
ncbi:MAG: TonB family protein [Elusimicrobiota bacterium]